MVNGSYPPHITNKKKKSLLFFVRLVNEYLHLQASFLPAIALTGGLLDVYIVMLLP